MAMKLRSLLSSTGFLLLVAAVLFGRTIYMNVRPADPLPPGVIEYSEAGFADAQASGAPILVDVYAVWCPTCLAQHKSLVELLNQHPYDDVRKFRVDFDRDTEFLDRFHVRAQSTLIMLRGTRELNRSVGVTGLESIRAQIDAALAQ